MAHGEASGKPAGEQAAGDDADGERGPSPDAEYLHERILEAVRRVAQRDPYDDLEHGIADGDEQKRQRCA